MALLHGYQTTTYTTSKSLQPLPTSPKKTQISEPNLSVSAPKQATNPLLDTPPAEDNITAEKSDKRFALRLTNSQRSKIKQLRKDWNLSTDAAVIKKLIDAADAKPAQEKALQIEELSAIRNELNHIGININQIARKANQLQLTQTDLKSLVAYMNKVLIILYQKGGL